VGEPYIESFNGRARDELLSVEEFGSVLEARVIVEAWRIEYNTVPTTWLSRWDDPAEYATNWTTEPLPVLPCQLDH
jgi:putative transposase